MHKQYVFHHETGLLFYPPKTLQSAVGISLLWLAFYDIYLTFSHPFSSLGYTYDISNKHRLGYSEVQLVQVMIDAVNTLWKEDLELQKKHGL